MSLWIKFILLLVGIVAGAVEFLFLIKTNLWYLFPFAGCCVGIWYALRFIVGVIKNHNQIIRLANAMQNLSYVIKKEANSIGEVQLKRFTQIITMEPGEFQKRY